MPGLPTLLNLLAVKGRRQARLSYSGCSGRGNCTAWAGRSGKSDTILPPPARRRDRRSGRGVRSWAQDFRGSGCQIRQGSGSIRRAWADAADNYGGTDMMSRTDDRPVGAWMGMLDQIEEAVARRLTQAEELAGPPAAPGAPPSTPLQVLDGRLAQMQARLEQAEADGGTPTRRCESRRRRTSTGRRRWRPRAAAWPTGRRSSEEEKRGRGERGRGERITLVSASVVSQAGYAKISFTTRPDTSVRR